MRVKKYLSLLVTVAFLLAMLPPQGSAQAIGVSAVRFGATCGDFSLMVAISGTTDDGGGFDRFRYQVLDGTGKKLYLENAARRVGVTIGSQVINMSYDNDGVDGPPTANPIRLQIVDLDANNNPTAILKDETFNASCLPPASAVTITENFRPTPFLKALFIGEAQLFRAPGRDPMDLRIGAGKEHFAFYRSPDSQWIAIDVSGEQLMWVPTSVVSVDIARLGVPPSRIDGSDPATGAAIVQPTSAPVVVIPPIGQPAGSALVTRRLRLRSEPSLRAPQLTVIPRNEVVFVYARNGAGTFIRVQYKDLIGWVSTCCVSFIDTRLDLLPRLE
ncbi:MAG: SH3 domain-containing protein [Anaerolineae bacterium]|nr:SH3 domain-containing protein [Anaerolineae bacterium]MDW8298291.1 SH3 domain-containing protein [Anaerolineae bacterium]